MASNTPLLQYAVCACAAKHLSRMQNRKPAGGNASSEQARTETQSQTDNTDWRWIGAEYYEKAVCLLLKDLPQDVQEWSIVAQSDHTDTNGRISHHDGTTLHSDETLGATAILSVYELLDATGPKWNRHSSGVMSLLDLFTSRGRASPLPYHTPILKGRKATFWNFVRQDILSAFINESHTRLETYNLTPWTEAGLELDDKGCMDLGFSGVYQPTEELLSQHLFFVLSKVLNFIANGEVICPENNDSEEPGTFGISQRVLLEQWHELRAELNAWHSSLPNTFQPCARSDPVPLQPVAGDPEPSPFQEIWYSSPICASTMQHYHMAKILLLANKPHESTARRTTVTTRLLSYRSIETEIRFHCQEICGP
ncbi:hypothetical protein BBP40_000383 [Aspergillus hancockii]|nr:hypothetical protein BBP40_000383 [Aspergillus hancockii]